MAVAAANLSRAGGFLLLSYLSRAGAGAGISLRRQKGISNSLPTQKGHFNFPPLKTTTTTTTSGSAPVTSNIVDSNSPDSDAVISEEDKLKRLGNILDIRVGQIIKIRRHEESEFLYIEEVDVGEPEPRIIVSGLVKYIPLENIENMKVVVVANVKPRNMRGVRSFGMLMAASDALHENVELLVPPEGSVPGDRVWFGSEDEIENLPDFASINQVQKKRIWQLVQPHLKSDASCVATLGMHLMRTSAGVIETGSIKNANMS